MAQFSNVNIEKMGDLQARNSAGHNLRQIPSKNVNPAKTHLNTFYVGNPNMDFDKELKSKLSKFPKIRKNAVKSVNLVFSASPELFRDKSKAAAWEKQTFDFIKSKFGLENIVYCVVHKDEKTPHFQVSIVPVDPKGKLNASHFFDGRQKCAEFATEYNNSVKNLGLKRDKGKEKGTHQSTADYYRRLKEFEKVEQVLDQKLEKLKLSIEDKSFLGSVKKTSVLQVFNSLFDIIKNYEAKSKANKKKLEEVSKLEAKVQSLEVKLESLGLSPNTSFMVCNELKPAIQNYLTAKAEKGASAPLKKENEVLNNSKTSIYQMPKPKPR